MYLKSVENVGKFIGLLFLFCLPLLCILFLKTKRNDLARPVMGTIFLVYIIYYEYYIYFVEVQNLKLRQKLKLKNSSAFLLWVQVIYFLCRQMPAQTCSCLHRPALTCILLQLLLLSCSYVWMVSLALLRILHFMFSFRLKLSGKQ